MKCVGLRERMAQTIHITAAHSQSSRNQKTTGLAEDEQDEHCVALRQQNTGLARHH